jgi:hypothetical protein
MSADNQELISELLKRLMRGMDEHARFAVAVGDGDEVEANVGQSASNSLPATVAHPLEAPRPSSASIQDYSMIQAARVPVSAPEPPAQVRQPSTGAASQVTPGADVTVAPDAAQLVGSFAVFHYLTKNLAFTEQWAKNVSACV